MASTSSHVEYNEQTLLEHYSRFILVSDRSSGCVVTDIIVACGCVLSRVFLFVRSDKMVVAICS